MKNNIQIYCNFPQDIPIYFYYRITKIILKEKNEDHRFSEGDQG